MKVEGARTADGAEAARIYSVATQTGMAALPRDLLQGLRMRSVWGAFAADEIQQRYRRSVLGVAWIILSYLFFVAAIAVFFGGFSGAGARAFTNYVAIGYAAFAFLVGNVVDGCEVFKQARTWIKSTPLPYSIYIYKSIARSLFPFVLQLAAAFAIMAAFDWRPTWSMLLALPALLMFIVNAVWVQVFMGYWGARYRDIGHLVSAITRVLFFTTPILWVFEERTGLVRRLAEINPFTHFIEIFRTPILGAAPSAGSWWAVGAITVAGWTVTVISTRNLRYRLPYWV